jgi:hypothetical protein
VVGDVWKDLEANFFSKRTLSDQWTSKIRNGKTVTILEHYCLMTTCIVKCHTTSLNFWEKDVILNWSLTVK